jgi:cholesterol transport system auxiliary component
MTNPPSTHPPTDRRRSLAAALLALGLSGCLGPSGPTERLFRLSDPQPAAESRKPALGGLLVVEGFEARGALVRQRAIIYRDAAQPNETQYYPASQWEEPPAAMIQSAMAACLDRAGLFDGVIRRDHRLRPRYTLAGELTRLEEQVAGSCSTAAIRLELTLIDENDNRVLLKGGYEAAEPATAEQVDQVLPAFDRALARLCTAVVGDIRSVRPGGPMVVAAKPAAPAGCGK